jgi:peptidoglycan/LPS O-acetylase OafA/YrhL
VSDVPTLEELEVPLEHTALRLDAQDILSQPAGRIEALDGLRGVACIVVLLDHIAGALHRDLNVDNVLIRVARSGWIGVDLFFVLSGFLITGILLENRGQAHYFRNFYARRSLRIFPLYFGVLALLLFRSLAFAGSTYGSFQTQLWLWTYTSNVGIALRGWEPFAFLGHLWSLSVEEHFYLVWPVLVCYLTPTNLARTAMAIVALVFVARIGAVFGGVTPRAVYILTPFRADGLALGGLLAMTVRHGRVERLTRVARWTVAITTSALIAFGAATGGYLDFEAPLVQALGFTLLATLSAALVILALAPGVMRRLLSSGVLRWFGKYSYGIYVWHPIVLVSVPVLLLHVGKPLRIATMVPTSLALVAAIALASWYFWEKPFLKLKHHFE